MHTDLLYQDDIYLREFEATVLAPSLENFIRPSVADGERALPAMSCHQALSAGKRARRAKASCSRWMSRPRERLTVVGSGAGTQLLRGRSSAA